MMFRQTDGLTSSSKSVHVCLNTLFKSSSKMLLSVPPFDLLTIFQTYSMIKSEILLK